MLRQIPYHDRHGVCRQIPCLSTDTVSIGAMIICYVVIYCLHLVFCVTRYLSCLFNLSSMASTVDTPNKGSGIQHDRKSWEVAFAEWLQQPGKSKKMWTSDYMKSVVAALSLNDEDVAAMEAGPEKKRVRVWRTRFALVNIAAEGSPKEYVVVRQGGEEEGKRCMLLNQK